MKIPGVVILSSAAIAVGNEVHGLSYYVSNLIMVVLAFSVSYGLDSQNPNRPTWFLRLSSTLFAGAVAYYLHPAVKAFEVSLFGNKLHPFDTVQLFIASCSFFGVSFFKFAKRMGDDVTNNGWRYYVGKLGEELMAISSKKKDEVKK